MKLIVGLGNPGKEYENTRHNIGFLFIDKFALSLGIKINKEKFNGLYNEILINGEKVILLKPLSYMNLSGEVVIKYKNFYKISIEDILIISDDLDLNFSKIKLKIKGSSGGHNGLKSIEYHLQTNNYKRLKVGISNNKDIDKKDYVLGKFNSSDLEIIQHSVNISCNICKDFLKNNIDYLMSKYNHN